MSIHVITIILYKTTCSTPQIRSHDFWRYINLYVCMYLIYIFDYVHAYVPYGRQQRSTDLDWIWHADSI